MLKSTSSGRDRTECVGKRGHGLDRGARAALLMPAGQAFLDLAADGLNKRFKTLESDQEEQEKEEWMSY